MKLAVCEDEPAVLAMLEELALKWAAGGKRSLQVKKYQSAESFLFDYEDTKDFDILLLDIQMKDISGMELAKRLRQEKNNAAVIFVTGVTESVFDGYLVQAVDYLLKPVAEERLFQALDRAEAQCKEGETFHLVQAEGAVLKIVQRDILCLESRGHDTVMYLKGRGGTGDDHMVLCRKSIGEWEKEMKNEKKFVFCHRSYLVNLSEIQAIKKSELELSDGSIIPIARGKREDVNRAWLNWCRGVLR